MVRFRDRVDAGRRLGDELRHMLPPGRYRVYGLARGGVVVARRVADALAAPLEVMAVAKIGAPGEPELAVGAVAEGGGVHWEPDTLRDLGLGAGWCERALADARLELERRRAAYRGAPLDPPAEGQAAVLVDDGLATGSTMLAAVDGLRRIGASQVVVAAPVASSESVRACERCADRVVALHVPAFFGAVGAYYDAFGPVGDEEVRRELRSGAERGTAPA
jgi:predicted phosphoribosyltransferase